MKFLWKKCLPFFRKWLNILLNPRLLLCFCLSWMITNGWSYLFVLIGGCFGISWMTWVGGTYLGLLWLPFTPEKIITVTLSILFLRLFFPNDKRTLAQLRMEFHHLRDTLFKRKKSAKETSLGAKSTESMQ